MDPDSVADLIYLVLLGSVILMYFIISNRKSLSKLVQQALLWALIFVGAIAAAGVYQRFEDASLNRQAVFSEQGRIEVPKGRDGHFHLTLAVDGVDVSFVVDTGASGIVLSTDDARRIGIDTDDLAYLGSANTANGEVRTARVTLKEIRLGDFRDRRVSAWVNEGEMDGSLLGMSYLNRFDRIEITGNRLVLQR
ncbi:MAG: retropepsin-like aspartic protease family protein [Brevirhabdus sp.]